MEQIETIDKKAFDVEFKKIMVNMLNWFHVFCEENGIRYYILGGTMLGAVRHNGFIPWDDDIDVGVPRLDYERLKKLLSNSQGEKYLFESPESPNKDYSYTYSKIYDTTTTLIEDKRIPVVRGVFLDVFPLDGIGNDIKECKKNFRSINWRFNLFTARTVSVRKGRTIIKNLAAIVARTIPENLIDNKSLANEINEICQEYDFEKCRYGGNLLSPWRFKEVMEVSVFGKPTLYRFEGIDVYGPEKYDVYLTNLYGDWKKLPPKEKQITRHVYSICNLYNSYLDI